MAMGIKNQCTGSWKGRDKALGWVPASDLHRFLKKSQMVCSVSKSGYIPKKQKATCQAHDAIYMFCFYF
jgi:hypothetical protein